jgi:hypothetical protein
VGTGATAGVKVGARLGAGAGLNLTELVINPIAAKPAQQIEMNFDALYRDPVAACSFTSASVRAANA